MTAFSRITAAEQLCHARVAATAPAPSAERQRQSWEERMASASERRKVVRAACPHDCPDTCAMLVTVEDGRAVAVRGDPEHLCVPKTLTPTIVVMKSAQDGT